MRLPEIRKDVQRRDFLRWLAASPLLASAGGLAGLEPIIAQEAPRRVFDDIIQSAGEALDVWDM